MKQVMDRPIIEMLSASLVREYLSRKKLMKSLSQLDEEQPGQCVRNRLELLKALHISKLMKRNKHAEFPLDSMIEVIVHFLLGHVRPSRSATAYSYHQKSLLQEGVGINKGHTLRAKQEPQSLPQDVGDSRKISVVGDCSRVVETSKLVAHDSCNGPSEGDVVEVVDTKPTDGGDSLVPEARKDITPRQEWESMRPRSFAEDTEVSVSASERTEFYTESNRETETSGSEDSESESLPSFASIVDLSKGFAQVATGTSRASEAVAGTQTLILRVPTSGVVGTALLEGDSDEDLEVIDAGEEKGILGGKESDTPGKRRVKSTWTYREDGKHDASSDELVSAKPSRMGMVSPPRPGTQDSAQTPAHLLWLHSDENSRNGMLGGGSGEGGDGRSPDLMKLNTLAPNFNIARGYDDALDTFRSHNNIEVPNNHLTSLHSNGHIPNGVLNGTVNGHSLTNGTVANGSFQLSIQGRSVFDTDVDDDIVKMAAQRDQLRGARSVRGMMAPVMSKEEDPRNRSANRRMLLTRQSSESRLGDQDILESREDMFPSMGHRGSGDGEEVVGRFTRRAAGEMGGVIGGMGGVGLRQNGDYLDFNRRGDIMAQSMRRQSLKGSKQNLLEIGYGNTDSTSSSRLSMGALSPEEFTIFKSENGNSTIAEEGELGDMRKNNHRIIPNSHEDIQILNLQGFMDNAGYSGDIGGLSKRKQRKKRGKRGIETGQIEKIRDGYKQSSRTRRKRNQKHNKSHLSDDDSEMTLKDIDDLDDKVAGLVIGPKTVNREAIGIPISLEVASHLRNLLTGSPAQTLPAEWMQQNFKQNSNPNLSYGLVQKKGGPCGVLACVQAYMMKCLVFGTSVSPNISPVSPLRPSHAEWLWALSSAIAEILWKAGEEKKAVLALPGSFPHFTEHGVGRYSNDGVTENLNVYEFVVQSDLYEAINRHISVFTAETGSGCVVLLYSLLLTRGLENVENDKDAGGGHLINAHGYSSQEIVTLLLTGMASTNTFNGDQTLGTAGQKMVLKGVYHRSDIGFLSLFEHYDSYKVGSHLKNPQYPIWVVCCESHYSVLFSRDTTVTSDVPPNTNFDIYYYDGLSLQEDEIRLTIDLEGGEPDLAIIPPMEHCIRTKWKNASVNWNGTEPIL